MIETIVVLGSLIDLIIVAIIAIRSDKEDS